MEFGNFLIIYSILSLFLVFPINILGENLSNHLRKESGEDFGYNIQRKLENDNYIIIKYNQEAYYSEQSFKTQCGDDDEDDTIDTRYISISKIIYNETAYDDINITVEANTPLEIHFSGAINSLESFFDTDYDNNCEKISYVDLSHFNSSALTSTKNMFYGCSSIQEINFTNFDTSSVENMYDMFFGCTQLKSLNLSNFDVSNVKDMESIFGGCTSLEYLDISNFNPDQLESNDYMFDGMNNIKYINIYNIQNGKLKQAINSNFNTKNELVICQSENILNNINAIYACCDFTKSPLKCDSNNYMIVKYNDTVNYTYGFINGNCPSRNQISYIINKDFLLKITEPLLIEANNTIEIHFSENITSLENFFNGKFDEYSQSIINVDLYHLNTSLITSTSKMFLQCTSIKEINFINFDTSSIESMSEMFSGCNSLEYINLSNFNTESVKNMSGMFSGCNLTTSLNLSSFNTLNTTDMSGMFSGCNSLEFINLSNFNTESVKNMSGMFSGCNLITSLNLSSFNTLNTIDMSEMFYGCDNLEILDISNFDTTNCKSYNNIFSNYFNLKYIDIKNLKDDKIIKDSFKNTKLFYVCQSTDLIRNIHAFNCCVSDIENNECDYIPPSTTILETTIIDESSFLIESTEYALNDQLNESTEQILSSEINEIPESISITTQNTEQTILSSQISESTKQILSTELIPSTQIKNNTKITTTETIEEKEQTTILTQQINTEHILSTELITNTQIKNNTKITTTEIIEEKEQTTNIKTEVNIQTDIKTEYQPTTYITHITNKIDTTETPTVPPETIYHSTFTKEITTNIPTIQTEKIQSNTTKIEKTEIEEKHTSDIAYTTQKENIETTNIQIKSTLIKETYSPINEFTTILLLGFSDFNQTPSSFSFYIYFITMINNIFSKIVTFPVIISYNRNIRVLKQVEANCTLDSIISSKNYKFFCEVHEETKYNNSISISPDFKFLSQDNIHLIGISPIAYMFMNNLKSIDEKYNALLNKPIYILDNSTFYNNDPLEFNISGIINGVQPKLENKNITIISGLKEKKSEREIEIDCIINNLTFNGYLLNCKTNESFHLDLQSAISFIDDDEILLFNFYNTSDFIIKNKDNKKIYSKRFFKNQTRGLSPGIIVALVIISIVAILSTIFVVYYFRRKNEKIENVENSTIKQLKSISN